MRYFCRFSLLHDTHLIAESHKARAACLYIIGLFSAAGFMSNRRYGYFPQFLVEYTVFFRMNRFRTVRYCNFFFGGGFFHL